MHYNIIDLLDMLLNAVFIAIFVVGGSCFVTICVQEIKTWRRERKMDDVNGDAFFDQIEEFRSDFN